MFRRTGSLPVLPKTCLDLVRAIDRENPSSSELERIVVSDPALTAELIRSAMTSPYSSPVGVDTSVRQLIMIIGLKRLRMMALGLAARRMSGIKSESQFFDLRDYKFRSFVTANLARFIHARLRHSVPPLDFEWSNDEVFGAASLSFLPHLLMAHALPRVYDRTYNLAKLLSSSFEEAFFRQYGGSLYALGACALESWRFPELFSVSQRYMLDPIGHSEQARGLACIRVAQVATGKDLMRGSVAFTPSAADALTRDLCPVAEEEVEIAMQHVWDSLEDPEESHLVAS